MFYMVFAKIIFGPLKYTHWLSIAVWNQQLWQPIWLWFSLRTRLKRISALLGRWVIKSNLVSNSFPQSLHFLTISSCNLFMCVYKLALWENLFSQMVHLNDWSPLWVISCTTRSLFVLKAFLHLLQGKSLLSLWYTMCAFRFPLFAKSFPQSPQLKDCFSLRTTFLTIKGLRSILESSLRNGYS